MELKYLKDSFVDLTPDESLEVSGGALGAIALIATLNPPSPPTPPSQPPSGGGGVNPPGGDPTLPLRPIGWSSENAY